MKILPRTGAKGEPMAFHQFDYKIYCQKENDFVM